MELVHTCGPAVSPDKNGWPSISDEMYFHPDKRVWYAGDDDGETRVIINFCPYCGLKLSTLEYPPNKAMNPNGYPAEIQTPLAGEGDL